MFGSAPARQPAPAPRTVQRAPPPCTDASPSAVCWAKSGVNFGTEKPQSLRAALEKALAHVRRLRGVHAQPAGAPGSLQAFVEKFYAQLYGDMFESPEQFRSRARELGLDFSAPAWAVAACEIAGLRAMSAEQRLTLCTGTVRMVRDTLEKFGPCTVTTLDMQRFHVLFPLREEQAADAGYLPMLLRTCADTVRRYFSVRLQCGIGGVVRDALSIAVSARSARCALALTGADDPVAVAAESTDAPLDPAALGPYKQRVVEDVTAYIRSHLDRRLSLNEVAAAFSFSPNYLSQLFAKHAERGFVETITHEKISAARAMMSGGGLKIYEIAERLGYESAFYFSKVFKKETGQSPREYMQRLQKSR